MKKIILLYIPFIGLYEGFKSLSENRETQPHLTISGFVQGFYISLLIAYLSL